MAKIKKKSKAKSLPKLIGSGNAGASAAASATTNLTQTPAAEPTDESKLVKTTPTPKTYGVLQDVGDATAQDRDLMNAFLAMAGIELFQYTNAQTIEGMDSDVAIINVLSSRRAEYTPNTMIELYPPWIEYMYLADHWTPVTGTPTPSEDPAIWKLGTDGKYDSMVVDVRGTVDAFQSLVVELYIKAHALETYIGTEDY
jgi:hypothetical protein